MKSYPRTRSYDILYILCERITLGHYGSNYEERIQNMSANIQMVE